MKMYGMVKLFLIFLAVKFQSMSAMDEIDKKDFNSLFKLYVKEDALLIKLRNQLDIANKDHKSSYEECGGELENPKVKIQQLQVLNIIEKEYNCHYDNLIEKFKIRWQQEKNSCLSSDLIINDGRNKEETKIISPP